MDSTEEKAHPLLACSLNEDCMLELFARCATPDLLKLRETCKLFNTLLTDNFAVWVRRLYADYGLKLAVGPSVEPKALFPFAQRAYTAPYNETLRFQAVLVNGGIDGDGAAYWADNLFRHDRSPYCSDCSTNADCLALLLDGEVQREQQYSQARDYLRRRCRYAAALLTQLNLQGPPPQTEEELRGILERWSDPTWLVNQLENDHAMGRLLLYDIPHDRAEAESARLLSVRAYLLERPRLMMQGMVSLPGELKTIFDASIIEKLPLDYKKRIVGVAKKVVICRGGSLTCPVASGVVFAGVFDRFRLKGMVPDDIAKALQNATQDATCSHFNGLSSLAAVEEHVAAGSLPPIECIEESEEGVVYQFKPPETSRQTSEEEHSSGPLISWRPLFWFRFNPVEQEEGAQGQLMVLPEGGGGEEEAVPDVENIVDAAQAVDEAVGGAIGAPLLAAGGEGQGSASPDDGMEEDMESDSDGSSHQFSEEDIQDLQQGQPLVFADAAQDALEQAIQDEEDFLHNRAQGRDTLRVVLHHPCTANALLVKLIDQENLMDELDDPHDWPNIDMTYVVVEGKRLELPPGIEAQP